MAWQCVYCEAGTEFMLLLKLNLSFKEVIYWSCKWYWTIWGSWVSSVGIVTCYGLDSLGIESWWGQELPCPPSLLYDVYRVFPGGKVVRAWCWPPPPLAPRLQMSLSYTWPPVCVCVCTGTHGVTVTRPLTFTVLCIINVFQSITNKIRYTVFCFCKLLRMFWVDPPPIIRSIKLYLQHLVFVKPLLLPATIVEEFCTWYFASWDLFFVH